MGLVTGLTLVQLLVQFVLQRILAGQFGSTAEMDAYVAVLALPVVISAMLAGSLGYVLVPVFAERRSDAGEQAAAMVTAQIGLYLLAISLVVAAAVAVAAQPIAGLLCPGFTPGQLSLAARLLRILAGLIVANSLVSFLNALHQCLRQFALPAAGGVIGTLVTVGYVALFIERQGIDAAAYGVLIGGLTTAAILVPPWLSQLRERQAWTLVPGAAVRRCLTLLVPLVLGSIYWRLDPLLDRYLGSFLSAGSLSHLGYAGRLTGALMLVGTSGLSAVTFPALAGHAAEGRRAELNAEIAHAWRLLIVLLTPVVLGLIGFSEPVTRLLYEGGAFSARDTQQVARLIVLSVGMIVGAGCGDLLSRVMYALHDTRTPVVVGFAGFMLGAALKFGLLRSWGAAGLVAATSTFYLFHAAVLTAVLLHRLGGDMLAGAAACLARSGVSAALACVAAWAVIQVPLTWAVLPAAAAGAVTYGLALWLLGDEFARRFLQMIAGSR